MKKKIFAPLLGAVVLGLSAYAGYHTYDAYAGKNVGDLLLANAEALAVNEDVEEEPTCGTDQKYIYNTVTCPDCGAHTGFVGTQYSYREEGFMSTYRTGYEGTRTSCTPYHGTQTPVNTVEEKKCDE